MTTHPILYSFRRCPYAMRARLGLKSSGITVELREIILRDKPSEMLEISPKATVPVLQLLDGTVIDESLDIALWALKQNDPQKLLKPEGTTEDEMFALIKQIDGPFKHHLDHTKYAVRYPDENPEDNRATANEFLMVLNEKLENNPYLLGNNQSLADITIAPFIRQFANIDKEKFHKGPWPHLINWLNKFIDSEAFSTIMHKYPQWQIGDKPTFFP